MIDGGRTSATQHSTFVSLESLARGVDVGGDGASIDHLHHMVSIAWDFIVSLGVNFTFCGVVLAISVLSSVGIIGLKLCTVSFEVFESSVSPSSLAALAGSVAINLLLRREFQEEVSASVVDAGSGLDHLSGGEGPARSTRALILDGCRAVTSVINVTKIERLISFSDILILGGKVGHRMVEASHKLSELSFGGIRQMVVSSYMSRRKVRVILDDILVSL